MEFLTAVINVTRPKQWIKNLLVAAAPVAAGQFSLQLNNIILGVIGFTSASIIGYLVNDWKDQSFDRTHPKKKFRPFACKKLKLPSLVLLILINIISLAITCIYLPLDFFVTVLLYLIITLSYTFLIKIVPVLEMIWVASGFLMRAIAGSAIIQQAPTGWFIVTVGFGALFMVSAKRLAELKSEKANQTRPVLVKYNRNFLNLVLTTSLSVTLLTYSLWIFQVYPKSLLAKFTILPFTLSALLYSWYSENKDVESPETLIFEDKFIMLCALAVFIPLLFVIYQ